MCGLLTGVKWRGVSERKKSPDIYPSFFLDLTDVSEERLETGQSVFILAVIGSDSNNYVFGLASHLSRHVEASSPHQMSEMPSCVWGPGHQPVMDVCCSNSQMNGF